MKTMSSFPVGVPVFSISRFLKLRYYETKYDNLRYRLLTWSWFFLLLSLIQNQWIEAGPCGKLGGTNRFHVNLHQICVLHQPGETSWIIKYQKEKQPEQTVFPERQLPFILPELENTAINMWQQELECYKLTKEIMKNWWILFPELYSGYSLNEIGYSLLIAALIAIPILLGLTILRIDKPISRIYRSMNPADVRICVMIDAICFSLDIVTLFTVAGAAFSTDFFFRPLRLALTTHSYKISRSLSQYSLWIATFLKLGGIMTSFKRLVRQKTVFSQFMMTISDVYQVDSAERSAAILIYPHEIVGRAVEDTANEEILLNDDDNYVDENDIDWPPSHFKSD